MLFFDSTERTRRSSFTGAGAREPVDYSAAAIDAEHRIKTQPLIPYTGVSDRERGWGVHASGRGPPVRSRRRTTIPGSTHDMKVYAPGILG